jgi:hypothetical protein
MDEVPNCQMALEQLAALDFTDWHGLSEACQPEDFETLFEGGDTEVIGRLSNQPQRLRVYKRSAVSEHIEVWFDEDTKRFMVATITNPDYKDDTAALLQTLGEPDAKLDALIGSHPDAEQWVYAARGLTLYVRSDEPPTFRRIVVYPPTTPEVYENTLGAHDHRRYHPRRR